MLVVAAASPYLTAAGVAAMILFGLTQHWVLTIVAALLCVVMIAVQLPRYHRSRGNGCAAVLPSGC